MTISVKFSLRELDNSGLSPAGGSGSATIVFYTETKTAAEPRVD